MTASRQRFTTRITDTGRTLDVENGTKHDTEHETNRERETTLHDSRHWTTHHVEARPESRHSTDQHLTACSKPTTSNNDDDLTDREDRRGASETVADAGHVTHDPQHDDRNLSRERTNESTNARTHAL